MMVVLCLWFTDQPVCFELILSATNCAFYVLFVFSVVQVKMSMLK